MNAIVPTAPQVPAHLAHLYAQPAAFNLGASVAAGISSGAHNRISIKQARWRLVNTQGEETALQTWHLDVLIVNANDHTSKVFYEGAYDPSTADNIAPRCWSDNGFAPSDRVSNPVNYTCANCPMNVFGSKITPAGKKTRACSDSKRLAVVLADNPDGLVYELRVPAASLTNMANAMTDMVKRGVRIETMVWRLEFDPQAEFPKITFTPAAWVNETQMAAVTRLMGSSETATIVNKDDKPMEAAGRALQPTAPVASLAAPVPTAAPNLAAPSYAPTAPVGVPALPQLAPVAPTQSFANVSGAMPPVGMPSVAAVAPIVNSAPLTMPAAPGNPLNLSLPPLPAVAPQQPIQVEQVQAADQTKRKRRSKAEMEAEALAKAHAQIAQAQPPVMTAVAAPSASPQYVPTAPAPMINAGLPPLPPVGFAAPAPAYAPPPPAANTDVPGALPAAASVPVHPQPTNPQLDALLAGLPLNG